MENPSELSPEYRILAVQDRSVISEDAERVFDELRLKGVKIVRCDKGETIADAVVEIGLSQDISIKSDDTPDSKLHFTHIKTDDADIYFVYNHSDTPYSAILSLRTDRTDIESWNPLNLDRTRLNTEILSLAPHESLFIVAR